MYVDLALLVEIDDIFSQKDGQALFVVWRMIGIISTKRIRNKAVFL